jgi:predicted nucleic acid-binding protein
VSREGSAVVDASLVIDFVLGVDGAASIGERIEGLELWAPAHIDAEVLSAFGRMERAGLLSAEQADLRLRAALEVPVRRELLVDLVPGAWARRPTVRLADALLRRTGGAFGRATVDHRRPARPGRPDRRGRRRMTLLSELIDIPEQSTSRTL